MSVQQMREKIKKPYGPAWHKKVDKMPDYQVRAVYTRFLSEGMI